jgi:hypothetical protein
MEAMGHAAARRLELKGDAWTQASWITIIYYTYAGLFWILALCGCCCGLRQRQVDTTRADTPVKTHLKDRNGRKLYMRGEDGGLTFEKKADAPSSFQIVPESQGDKEYFHLKLPGGEDLPGGNGMVFKRHRDGKFLTLKDNQDNLGKFVIWDGNHNDPTHDMLSTIDGDLKDPPAGALQMDELDLGEGAAAQSSDGKVLMPPWQETPKSVKELNEVLHIHSFKQRANRTKPHF